MVQTLEAIRGGGGSIKVGTTGKISALMSRELESMKPVLQTPVSHRNMFSADCASIPTGVSTPKVLKSRGLVDEASSSGTSNGTKRSSPELVWKAKQNMQRTSQVPILDSDNISIDGTPIRQKSDKRMSYMVKVVDIKCGHSDRAWASPITNRLKKLGFSKLSESIV